MPLVARGAQPWPVTDCGIAAIEPPEEILALALLLRLGKRVGEPSAPAAAECHRPIDLQLHRVVPGLHPIVGNEHGIVRQTAAAPGAAAHEVHVVAPPEAVVRQCHTLRAHHPTNTRGHLHGTRRHHVVRDEEHLRAAGCDRQGSKLRGIEVLLIPGSTVRSVAAVIAELDPDHLELPSELLVEERVPIVAIEVQAGPPEQHGTPVTRQVEGRAQPRLEGLLVHRTRACAVAEIALDPTQLSDHFDVLRLIFGQGLIDDEYAGVVRHPQRVRERCRCDVVVVDHVRLPVPAEPEIEHQPVSDGPVVLDEDAELLVVPLDGGIAKSDEPLKRLAPVLGIAAEVEDRVTGLVLRAPVGHEVHVDARLENVITGETPAGARDVIAQRKAVLLELLFRILAADAEQTEVVPSDQAKVACHVAPGEHLPACLRFVDPPVARGLEVHNARGGPHAKIFGRFERRLSAESAEIVVAANAQARVKRVPVGRYPGELA